MKNLEMLLNENLLVEKGNKLQELLIFYEIANINFSIIDLGTNDSVL